MKEVIKELTKLRNFATKGTTTYRALDMAIEALEAQRWIPVSERVPEKKTEVIYSLENHYVSTGYMTDRDYEGNIVKLHWEDIESGVLIYPEAWMPLPKPYMEGNE